MYEYNGTVSRVVDGDTFDIVVDLGFHIHHKIRVRLKDLDTPEIYRPSNDKELEHARQAKEYVESLFKVDNRVVIHTFKERGSSFGRFVGDVFVHNAEGKLVMLKELLTNMGLVKLESYE